MAVRIRPAFFRPIEIITGTNDRFIMTIAATPHTVIIPQGVYACVLPLMNEVATHIVSDTPQASATIQLDTTSGQAVVQLGSSASGTESALLNILGFTSNIAASDEWIADDYPEYYWAPTYQTTEQGRWHQDHGSSIHGVTTKDGSLVGRTSGPIIYYRDLNFIHESAEQVFTNGTAGGGDAEERCLDYFARQSMISYPAAASHPATRGFYFFEDVNDALGAWSDDTMANNGISSDDPYQFAQFGKRGFSKPIASAPTGRDLYSVTFKINSAATSTWKTLT